MFIKFIVNFKNQPLIRIDMVHSKKDKVKSTSTNPIKPIAPLNTLSTLKNIDELKKTYDLSEGIITPVIILHKMAETLELYLKIIQEILQPEEFNAVYECSSFTDADKPALFDLYKRIIIAHREILKALIVAEEKNSLSTIQFIHEEVQNVKPQMLKILEKMQQSWKEVSKDKQRGPKQYFG
jgi:hypothetical protein